MEVREYTPQEREHKLKIVRKVLTRSYNRTLAAKRAGISRNTMMKWADKFPEWSDMMQETLDNHLDRAERSYIRNAKDDKDHISTRHLLRTKRTREWGTLEEQLLLEERDKWQEQKPPTEWQAPLDVLDKLMQAARQGLSLNEMAFYAGVIPQELKDSIKDGFKNKESENAKVTIAVITSWAYHLGAIRSKYTGQVLYADRIESLGELSNMLTNKDIHDDISSLLGLED